MKKVPTGRGTHLPKAPIFCVSLCMMLLFSVSPKLLIAQDAPLEVIQAAEEGLPRYLGIISKGDVEDFGFSEDDNLDEAVLGRPFLLYVLTRAAVENYREGDTIYEVLEEGATWYFPIMIGDEIKCMLLVEQMDNYWEAVACGGAGLARKIHLVRKVWPISEGYDPIFTDFISWYFSVPQVNEYNLTGMDYYPATDSDEVLRALYEDLRPLSETMEYLASEIADLPEDDAGGRGGGGGGGGGGSSAASEGGNGACFISTAADGM
jgi:hypothetical protein